ncbi:class I SAM-dependent DNA methyltransferase [Sorangium sp. So ce216]
MITGHLRTTIDKLWEDFWTGGITNPLTVIEQISFLMFARLLDITETANEKAYQRTKRTHKRIFGADQQHLRWHNFKEQKADAMLKIVREGVFEHFRSMAGSSTVGDYMADAQLMIQNPRLLVSAVNAIDALPLTAGDIKGDLYEYLLGKLTTAGINGQFRTPRHIIRFMVELVEPQPTETVGDPACGTAGFLVGAMQYLLEKHTSKQGVFPRDDGSKTYTGDLLKEHWKHIQEDMFHGFDFDATMLRIASMNLLLHGVDAPDIHYQDTLSKSFPEKFPKQASGGFDVILANPPFKGSLAEEDVHPSLTGVVKTKKTELLFLALILRMLRTGGRSATIVPDGVLFGSSRAHKALRQLLVENHQLEAVISLPSGVFKPYAGVSTAILVFKKDGKTEHVFFYDVEADGFSLDDKREPVKENDLPDALERWRRRGPRKDADRSAKAFMVPARDIRENEYELSVNRYKEIKHEQSIHETPETILDRLQALEQQICNDLTRLKDMLR